jgi:hypothetical protein
MVSQKKFGQAAAYFHLILRWDPKPHFIDQILKNKYTCFKLTNLDAKMTGFHPMVSYNTHPTHPYKNNSLGPLAKRDIKILTAF